MVSPLGNVRVGGAGAVGGESTRPSAPGASGADFEALLRQAVAGEPTTTGAPPAGGTAATAALIDSGFMEAFQSIERAGSAIRNARAYFRNATPSPAPTGGGEYRV